MLNKKVNRNLQVRFRRWTRKTYAVFASLGKAISIGNLRIDMAGQTLFRGFEHITRIFTDDSEEESQSETLFQTIPVDTLMAAEMLLIPVSKEIEAGVFVYNNINQTVRTA